MSKLQDRLESEINGTIYFSIAGDNTEALRKSELYKLSALVFEYCNRFMYAKGGKASYYGEEIYKTTKSCLDNFKPEMTVPFLNYLKAALSKSIKRADFLEKKTIQKLGREYVKTQTGENYSLVNIQISSLHNPEEELTEKEAIMTELETVDDVFRNKQERVKAYLSKLVTREYIEKVVRFFGIYSFVDVEMVKNVLFKKGSVPSQKDIAIAFGRLEADASRTMGKFRREVEQKLKKKC